MVLSVGDRVKCRATFYDAGTEDENGLTFSQRQLGKGLGAFCFGAVTHVYRKVGRQSQKYRVKWDDGTVSQVLIEHLELVSVQEGSSDVVGGRLQTSMKGQITTDLSLLMVKKQTMRVKKAKDREMELKLQGSVVWLKRAM
jgi:hypothetical protein